MQKLLRSLVVLAVVLVAALAAVPSAKALPEPQTLESACVDGQGYCSSSTDIQCATRAQCPTGESCICY